MNANGPIDRNVDLRHLLGLEDCVVGHIEPINHPVVKDVYVVLHRPGPISAEHQSHIAQFAQAAAEAAAAQT